MQHILNVAASQLLLEIGCAFERQSIVAEPVCVSRLAELVRIAVEHMMFPHLIYDSLAGLFPLEHHQEPGRYDIVDERPIIGV